MNNVKIIIPLIIIILVFDKSNYEILNADSDIDHYDRLGYEFMN